MAKPLTRLVRRLCNKIGYDFVRLQNIRLYEGSESGLEQSGGFDAFEKTLPRPIEAFDIYFRSCARVEIHGQDRARINRAPKSEVLKRSLTSLVKSINYAVNLGLTVPLTLQVIDDHSSEEVIEAVKLIIGQCQCPVRIHSLEQMDLSFSLRRSYELARSEAKDVIYFIEDDYLHDRLSILATVESYGRLASTVNSDVILFPADYPALYRRIYPTQIILGSDRHWRRIGAMTGTQVIPQSLLRANWDTYVKFATYGTDPAITEDNTINRILDRVPGFSPLPALAVHFQQLDTMSPYVDWERWWEDAEQT